MPLENLGIVGAHPTVPPSGTYLLYVLSSDGQYYLASNSQTIKLMANPLTTDGDILYQSGGAPTRLPVGLDNQVLAISSGAPVWQSAVSSFPSLYKKDLGTQRQTTTSVRILPGECRSDDDTFDMTLSAAVDADITSSGAGGLDTGTAASNTWFYIWLIYNPTTTTYAAMLSLSSTAPTMPSGYTLKRRVGTTKWRTVDLIKFRTIMLGSTAYVQFDEFWAILSAASSTIWVTLSAASYVPPTSRMMYGIFYVERNNQTTGLRFNENGSSQTYPFLMQGYDSTVVHGHCPLDTSQQLQYQTYNAGDAASIFVFGYIEEL